MDVLLGLLALQVQELRHDEVRDGVVDRRSEEHDAFLEQPRVDVERPFAAIRLLDDDGYQVILWSDHVLSSWLTEGSGSGVAGAPSLITSADSTSRSRAFDRMISPASDVTCLERSRILRTSFGSRPVASARTRISRSRSSAVAWIPSCRATASRTRSALSPRMAWARASARKRSSSQPWDSRTASSVVPARSARSFALSTRRSVSLIHHALEELGLDLFDHLVQQEVPDDGVRFRLLERSKLRAHVLAQPL